MKEIRCLWILSLNEGKLLFETDRRIGAASAVLWTSCWTVGVEGRAECEGKDLDLVRLHFSMLAC